jgi:hypothetical protein
MKCRHDTSCRRHRATTESSGEPSFLTHILVAIGNKNMAVRKRWRPLYLIDPRGQLNTSWPPSRLFLSPPRR